VRRVVALLSGRGTDDHCVDAVQIFRRVVVNFDAALLLGLLDDADLGAEDALQFKNGGLTLGSVSSSSRCLGLRPSSMRWVCARFGARSHPCATAFSATSRWRSTLGSEQRQRAWPRISVAQRPVAGYRPGVAEAEEIDDGGAVLTGALSDLIGVEEEFRPAGQRQRRSRWVQILALDVLMRVISSRRSSGISRITTGTD